MFTGIIEGLGTVDAVRPSAEGKRLAIRSDFDLHGTRIGDSICVNGACLTVVRLEGRRFDVDVSPETIARTTFGSAAVGERVNLERALRLGDRLDGHLVSGHIDGLGHLEKREKADHFILLTFTVTPGLTKYMIEKGSVAVDGVSLTVNYIDPERFQVSIIPHTAKLTTIGQKNVGDAYNIETDLIGKYVERFVTSGKTHQPEATSDVTLEFLAKSGYLDT